MSYQDFCLAGPVPELQLCLFTNSQQLGALTVPRAGTQQALDKCLFCNWQYKDTLLTSGEEADMETEAQKGGDFS